MTTFITVEDLEAFVPDIDQAKAEEMIADAEALAMLAAPCLKDTDFQNDKAYQGAVKAVLRGAILRWDDSAVGAVTQVGAGGFQQSTDTRVPRRSMFWPSEIDQLRKLCTQYTGEQKGGAYTVDTAPRFRGGGHRPWCALAFGAAYCSCGTDIAGKPIYEEGYQA